MVTLLDDYVILIAWFFAIGQAIMVYLYPLKIW